MEKSLTQLAQENLDSETCQCGRPKRRGNPFCMECFHKLPKNMRVWMYKSFSENFVSCWDQAKDWLRENT